MNTDVIYDGLVILGALLTTWALLTCRKETRLYTLGLLTAGTCAMFTGSRLADGLGDWLTIFTGAAAVLCAALYVTALRKAWRRTGGAS
jgi:hypothetical protein